MRHSIFLLLSTLALAGAAPAMSRQRSTTCNITAYLETGPRLGVRSGPSANARLLQVRSQGSPVAEITGQSGAWFRISRITDYEDSTTLFRGTGWIRVSAVGTSVANYDPWLYARPARQSRRLTRLVPEQSRVTLLGCTGEWVQVRAGRRVGWLSRGGQCSNPLTTCV